MSHRTQSVVLVASVAVAVAAIVVSLIVLAWYTQHLAAERRAEQVAGCVRANQQRVYINRLVSVNPDLNLPPIHIPDCEEIIK